MIKIEDHIDKLKKYFQENNNIIAVWIIGSYGTENQHTDSDIDFAFLFDTNINVMEEMSIVCDISDILSFENIDIINLLNAPITLQSKVINEGRNLYEQDYIKVSDYMETVFNRCRDEIYYLNNFMDDFYKSFENEKYKHINFDKTTFLEDFTKVDSAKYLLQISIEAMLEIGNHLIARNRWGKPVDNKDHFKILSANNIIKSTNINIYFNMAKFRNRIVHMYFNISDEMIYDIVQNNLGDFERFIGSITKAIK